MSVNETPHTPLALTDRLPLSLRLAWRDFRGGLSGFAIFIACIALGVMVITGVGALSDTLRSGLQDQGRLLIGGDISIARMHTALSPDKLSALREFADVAETATMRTMARKTDGSDQMLAELKAVDEAYPLVGQVQLKSGSELSGAIGKTGTAVVDEILTERLGLQVGDRFTLGTSQLEIAGIITREPDGVGDRLTFGPRIMMSRETLDATGLVKPGTLIRWRYALALPDGGSLDSAGLQDARARLKSELSDQGFTILDRRDPSPQIRRTLDRLRQFLTLVGLTALLVGGVGVANAVAAFIDKRRKSIATMKSLGASNRTVLSIYLSQILLVTALGIVIGLGAGLMIPWLINMFLGHLLPFPATVTVSAFSIALACAYGLLVALVFALWPLGRAERVTAAVLFRDDVEETRTWPYRHIIIATLLVGGALVALAILSSDARKVAIAFTLAVTVIFALFIGLGWFVTRMARRIPRPSVPELALALGNIGSPGGLTRSVVLSLGAGLSLLMAVALADASIVKELEGRLPENAPDYFVVDIPRTEIARFRETVTATVPDTQIYDAPMLRGRIVALKGTPGSSMATAASPIPIRFPKPRA